MKIVDTKTGKIYNSVESFWEFYCNQHELCRSDKDNICPLFKLAGDEDCFEYFKKHLMECQSALGYVVEKGKPLSEWTIAEVRNYCESVEDCEHCNIYNTKYDSCPFTRYGPSNWIINKYDETEKDTAQFLINQFGAETVECIEDNENLLIKKDKKIIATVCKEWFPNVTERTKLSDIVEE